MEKNYFPSIVDLIDDDGSDFDDDVNICEYCGRDVNGYDSGPPCPSCCPHDYACGTEECDFCQHSDECCRLEYC